VELSNLNIKNGLCISLGANIDSKFGKPIDSLILCRPEVEEIIKVWINDFQDIELGIYLPDIYFSWSSIYISNPHGITEPQPNYLNSILLIKSYSLLKPSSQKIKSLLEKFKILEEKYGRDISKNNKKWLSRCLDLDILWWENLNIKDVEITLPHPRFTNRNFIITPLAEVLSRAQKVEKLEDNRWQI
tara:strand:- start:650 stop:1213 length:564 start_codon:yes stop_codon:yes gene_type:complete